MICVIAQSLALNPTYAASCPGGGGPEGGGPGGGASVIIEYQWTGAGGVKCRIPELLHDDDPRVHMYHNDTIHDVYNSDFSSTYTQTTTNTVTTDCSGTLSSHTQYSEPGTVSSVQNLDIDVTYHELGPGPTCVYTNYYEGTYTSHSENTDSRHITDTGCSGGIGDCQASCYDYQYGLDDVSASPAIVNSVWQWSGTDHSVAQSASCRPCPPSYTNDTTNPWGATIHCGGYEGVVSELRRDHMKVSIPDSTNGYYTIDLEGEYTDGELRTYIMSQMPAYGGWFQAGAGEVIAYSLIGGNHVDGGGCWGGPALLGKMKFRFGVPESKAGAQYNVTYDLITWDITTGQVDVNSGSSSIGGTGSTNSPAYGGETEVMPPYWDDSRSPCGGIVITFLANVRVSTIPPSDGSLAGSGPFLSAKGGCVSCGGSSGSNNRFEGFGAAFTMGQSALDQPAPQFQITSSVATTNLATPASLYYPTSDPNVEVIQVANQVRQVKGPQALADVVTLDSFSYEIRYYLLSQVGSKVSGVYTLSGSPYVTWKIQNPDASTTTFNRIRITETRGTDVRIYDSTNTVGTSNWQIGYPGNLVELDQISNIDTNGMSLSIIGPGNQYYSAIGYKRTITTTTKAPGGSDQLKVKRIYQRFGWGEGLVEETLSPDSNPKTTTYTYAPGYWTFSQGQPVERIIYPDGSWNWYQYDSIQRVSSVYSGFGDIPPTGSSPSWTARHMDYYYADSGLYELSGSGDIATLHTNIPRAVLMYEGGWGIGADYTIFPAADTRIDIQTTQDPNSWGGWGDWDDPSNLFTTNKYYSSGVNLNRLKSTVRPDGTLTTYDYADDATGNYRTNMTATGQPNGAFTVVVDGTTNWSVVNLSGKPVVSVTKDIVSGIVLAQETYSNFDNFGRPGRVTHLDGTYEDTYYSCCGLDSTIDRDSVTTTHIYDGARREVAQTRQGITTTNILDSVGHTLKTIRIGTDGSQIIKGQWQYDLAGSLVKQTNALNGVTSYSETTNSLGARVTITTYPDGGTRCETNYLDGRLKQVGGTAANPVRYEYGNETGSTGDTDDYGRRYTLEIKLNADGTDSQEWTKTYIDNLGRVYKTMYSDSTPSDLTDNPYSKSCYNSKGQLWKERDPDGVVTLFQYDAKGEMEYTAVDMNRNDTIDFTGTDRITRTVNDVVNNTVLGANVRRSRSYAWSTDNSNTSTLLSTAETSIDGLHSWQTTYRDGSISVTNRSDTVFGGSGYRYSTNIVPDRSYTVSITRYGTNVSSTRYDANNTQLGSASYLYDTHLRANRIIDARNGTMTNWFNNQDQINGTKTPVPAAGQSALVTSNYFDTMGRIFATKLPDGTFVTNKFDLKGMVTNTFGSRTYPVTYTFDSQGRQKTMTTWQNYAGNQGAATTTWYYDLCRGWMTNKTYADGHGTTYSNTFAGRLASRIWARGVSTTYSYNNAGDLSGIDYSDGTPDVTYTFDRRGQQKTIVQNGITTTLTYNDASQVLTESYSGGTLDGYSVTNGYDQLMRRTNLAALYSTTPLLTNSYSYDAVSRLQKVGDGGTNSATYVYLANSPLVSQILFTNGNVQRMVTTKSYDLLNRLTNIASTTNGTAIASFAYQYNTANQRTKRTDVDGSYWVYAYDSLGQVTSGKKFWSDNSSVAGMQFTYSFDDIGNRKSTGSGGDQTGGPLKNANYSANNLNQYTSRDVPGFVNVIGSAKTNAAVSLWTPDGWWSQTIRHSDYYRGELAVNNSTGALWLTITNQAVLGNGTNADIATNSVGNLFLPKNREVFNYDWDGNLTTDGRWNYTWDAENRLIRIVANTATGPQQRLDFEYDSKSRRIRKKVWNNTAGTGTPATDLTFVYDRLNLISELNSSHSAVRTYTWGLDLSGSMQGAAGVGGLLQVNNTSSGAYLSAFDGLGNVTAFISIADGSSAATYDYSPFGEPVRVSTLVLGISPFRLSTRYCDTETDLLMYPRRAYSSSSGRWLSRDPAQERGGGNLYRFVNNTLGIDPLGLVQLHYIDHPKWSIIDKWDDSALIWEVLWGGHYLTFDTGDAGAIGGAGVLLVHHKSSANITDCESGLQVTPSSKDWYFANRFDLNGDGTLQRADNTEEFTDGQYHLFAQIGSFSMSGMFNRYAKKSGSRFTKGSLHSVMEFRVIPRDAFDGGDWDTDYSLGYDMTDINGHELGRSYWGRTDDGIPTSWDAPALYSQTITLDFSWDNCLCSGGGNAKWNFRISPWLTERGEQRRRYQDSHWVGTDLVLTPNR